MIVQISLSPLLFSEKESNQRQEDSLFDILITAWKNNKEYIGDQAFISTHKKKKLKLGTWVR